MSDPIGRCASTGPTCGRDDASAQLKNYAIAAGAVATAVGGVTGASNAAIVTSSGSGPVWAGSVNAAGTQSNSAWDDAFLNNKFWAVVIQAGSTAAGARYMTFKNFAGRVHVGRLSTGAVIGATGSTLFDLPQGFVKVRSNGGSNAGWSAQPQTNWRSDSEAQANSTMATSISSSRAAA